jgi:hypothetical protein
MRVLLLVLALAVPALVQASSSIRCDGGLVSAGDTKLDLLGKCGSPTLRDARDEERGHVAVEREGGLGVGQKVTVTVEQWTYDFGPQRFVYVATLEGGKVIAIERGGYGYAREAKHPAVKISAARCESSALRVGDTKLDLLARCGEPATKDRQTELRSALTRGEGVVEVGSTTLELEVWTYDFGANRFIYLATLENGKVTAVERGGYGYAR